MNPTLQSKIEGLLIGTAVADTIGLPTEGMTPQKIHNLGWASNLKHRFLFGKGMWSDDTEQTIMLAQALLHSEGDLEKFTRSFAWELRWWILGLPAATGLATVRALVKLWLGFSPKKSGVFSAGNGCTMRTVPIAAFFPDHASERRAFTEAQTRITHSDPKALIATLAITELCHLLLNAEKAPSTEIATSIVRSVSDDEEWASILDKVESAINDRGTIENLLISLGANPERGVSGYVYQTVPAVLLAGIKNKWDFQKTITELIAVGGDTDTTAAIAGALCGACHGVDNIPPQWVKNLREWSTSIQDLSRLAEAIAEKKKLRIRPRWSPLLLVRNLILLLTVLFHGFARLLPSKS